MGVVYYFGELCRVFSVKQNAYGEPLFLIYFDKRWQWVHSMHCTPKKEKENEEKLLTNC